MEGLVYKGDLLSVEIADVMSWMLMRYTLGISGVSECELSDGSGISSFPQSLRNYIFWFCDTFLFRDSVPLGNCQSRRFTETDAT